MTGNLVRSRFRSIYIGLLIAWVAASIGAVALVNSWLEPVVLQSRAQSVESVVRPQREALLYFDNRTTREELQRVGAIKQDQDFTELNPGKPSDRDKFDNLLKTCKFITSTICANPTYTLVLSDPPNRVGIAMSFALLLEGDYCFQVHGSLLWKCLASLIFAVLLLLTGWAIRQQEKFFIGKISLLAKSFSKVERSFHHDRVAVNEPSDDEFLLLSQGLDQAATLLEKKTAEIEVYKKSFKKKTQIEQLAQTINYTSHNLKAPILEGIDFFQNLPYYLESMPREKIIRMGSSLEKRFAQAGESLQNALSKTRESYTRPENVAISEILRTFCQEVKNHPHYSDIQVELETEGFPDQAQIFCSPQEMGAALWNLTKNSRDAKKDAQIRIRAFATDAKAVVHFQDNGPGIPEFQRERVFEDFFTTKPTGTGLGLGSVKSTVNKCGGTIEAISSPSGALFKMTLPLTKPLMSEAGNA